MQRTLIAVFESRGDAQSAIDDLVSSGFSRSQIRLSEGDPTGRASTVSGARNTATSTGGGILDSIRNFFGNMFGTDDSEHVQKYSDAVTRGHHVLTVTAPNESEIERSADIVERWGPVDIDEKAAEWSGGPLASEAMRSGAGAQQQRSASMSQQSTQGAQSAQGGQGATQGGTQGSMQGSAEQGSQQFASGAAGSAVPVMHERVNVRVFEHIGEPPVEIIAEDIDALGPDDHYFRNHYNSNYAGAGESYDDYAPAYKYGSEMANSETYRGRLWKDVEPQLRSDWEERNPGSAWQKFKAAVKHGWERITH
jgi:hypothetical protein